MAQLKEDEWPQDGEPTTSEQEGTAFKAEQPQSPAAPTGRPTEEINRAAHESVINTVEPDRLED